ncbi:MAG: hypothetical protein HYX55_05510 [Chloroflexi bacterium]|nr:hypothetical protein [Chloroflexota bacterium]
MASSAALTPPRRTAPSARLLNLLLGGALVLAIAGVSFAAGRFTAPAAIAGSGNFPGGQGFNGNGAHTGNGAAESNRPGGGLFGAGGGTTIEGTVDSITATTLSLKLASGQTIQIAIEPGTTYHAQASASSSDVASGGKVLVRVNLRPQNGTTTVNGPSASDITVVP